MKLDANKLALATGIVSAVIWIICSALVSVMPGGMMQMSGHMLHANLDTMQWTMTWTGFVIGLILWTVVSAVVVWAVAAVYNRLVA